MNTKPWHSVGSQHTGSHYFEPPVLIVLLVHHSAHRPFHQRLRMCTGTKTKASKEVSKEGPKQWTNCFLFIFIVLAA